MTLTTPDKELRVSLFEISHSIGYDFEMVAKLGVKEHVIVKLSHLV